MCKLKPSRRTFDCIDSEYEIFIRFINPLQQYHFFCGNNNCVLKDISINNGRDLFFKPNLFNSKGEAILSNLNSCSNCLSDLSIRFINNPSFILIQPLYNFNDSNYMYFDNIPKTLNLDNREFYLLCCTTHKNSSKNSIKTDHFCAIYEIENRKFYIDDLNTPSFTENIPNIHKISTCFYYLK